MIPASRSQCCLNLDAHPQLQARFGRPSPSPKAVLGSSMLTPEMGGIWTILIGRYIGFFRRIRGATLKKLQFAIQLSRGLLTVWVSEFSLGSSTSPSSASHFQFYPTFWAEFLHFSDELPCRKKPSQAVETTGLPWPRNGTYGRFQHRLAQSTQLRFLFIAKMEKMVISWWFHENVPI